MENYPKGHSAGDTRRDKTLWIATLVVFGQHKDMLDAFRFARRALSDKTSLLLE
jgi:hypothetical protein